MALRDWLDAGERMLLEKIDNPLLMGVFERLFAAEDQETVDNGFDELAQLSEVYGKKLAEAEAKERAETGLVRRESASTLAEAAAEWGMDIPERKEPPA